MAGLVPAMTTVGNPGRSGHRLGVPLLTESDAPDR